MGLESFWFVSEKNNTEYYNHAFMNSAQFALGASFKLLELYNQNKRTEKSPFFKIWSFKIMQYLS